MIVDLLERTDKEVTISINGEVTTMVAEEFDENFKEVEPGKFEACKEFVDMINHKLEDIEKIIPDLMIFMKNPESPLLVKKMGKHVTEYAKKWHIDQETATMEITMIFQRFIISMSAKMGCEPDDLKTLEDTTLN